MKLENEPRITRSDSFFQELIAWARRVALSVNQNTDSADANAAAIVGKVNRSGDTMTGGLNLVSPSTSATEANSDNSTRIATTAWVRNAMSNIASSAGFAISTGTNGYVKLPSWLGGWIFQWGTVSYATSGSVGVSFPLTFPNACRRAMVVMETGSTASVILNAWVTSLSTSGASFMRTFYNGTTLGLANENVSWVAVGY